MNASDFLLIDAGNTSTKLRLATRERLVGRTHRVATDALRKSTLDEAVGDWRFGSVVMSSVVPAAARVLEQSLTGVYAVNFATDAGIDLRGYPGRKTLGADRIANMAGVLALCGPGPLIVVDFGTAATFNALDAKGRFLGGAIAPGWGVFNGCLPNRAAQLPAVKFAGAVPEAVGRNTVGAIRSGTLLGYRGMVREILQGLWDELGGTARVVATGGDAKFLAARRWGFFDVVDPNLTLEGLRVIAGRLPR